MENKGISVFIVGLKDIRAKISIEAEKITLMEYMCKLMVLE